MVRMHHQRDVILLQMVVVHWFLLWKGVIYGHHPGYSIQTNNSVTVQEGLCVTIPCTFTAGDCTLNITDARKGDAGSYYFRFEENESSQIKYNYMEKTTVKLTVIDLKDNPQIITNRELIAGEEANLTCIPPGNCNRASSNVQWMKSDHNGTWNNASFVKFTPSKSDHQTNVTCRVTFQNGTKVFSKRRKLNVRYPPSVTVKTAENKTMHRYENVGGQQPVTLICRADGNPKADVTWYKENNIVNRSKSSSTLHITIMNPTTYTCLAWNELGMDLQHVVFLQETTVRDVLIGVACGITISIIIVVVILFIFWSRTRSQPALKPDLNHPQGFLSSQDIPPNDNSQLYAQVQKPRLQVSENPHKSSNLTDVSYASIKFSKAVAKGTPMQPETEYSEIKFP
ncbi:sialic acid-binding Ig-like lectin 12 isoform X1 [Aquarana catesbeiana]|uniref:sialic acid-binding Ig-like lectin 12 isoform X1 n=1 Tax=Aquarana catesbeiana TaxID=8400 RepID=UPI003CC93333